MLVTVGKILKPRGLKGELKVEILTNRTAIFTDLKIVFIGGVKHNVVKSSVQNGFAYLNLKDVDVIEKAECFRNKDVQIDEADFHLQDNEVLSTQLIGFAVMHQGKKIGVVNSVENFGGGDFFEIAVTGAGYLQIPNEDEFILETNMTQKTLTLSDYALQEEII